LRFDLGVSVRGLAVAGKVLTMTANGWLQIFLFLLVIFAVAKPAGLFMARVFAREKTFLDPLLRPFERLLYKVTGVDEKREMRWTEYAIAMLLFSGVSMTLLYLIERVQQWLPWNPQKLAAVPMDLAFNTAASFTTNTNWQAYTPEVTMSYFTQMAGLAYHNFTSAAVGIAMAIAIIRGIARREQETIGNFWVDMTRAILWVLLPVCLVVAMIFVSQGMIQNLRPYTATQMVDAQTVTTTGTDGKTTTQVVNEQLIPQGPVAGSDQDFRHERRRILLRQQLASLRKSDAADKFPAAGADFCDSLGADVYVGTDDGFAAAWLGSVGRNGGSFSCWRGFGVQRGGARESAFAWRGPAGERDAIRRQYGGERSAVRHREYRAVCNGDDRCELRRGEWDA
jgi:hypothetical protein